MMERDVPCPPPAPPQVFEELLAPDFKMREDLRHDAHPRTYFRADFIELMDAVARAIPDFSWRCSSRGAGPWLHAGGPLLAVGCRWQCLTADLACPMLLQRRDGC